MAMSKDMEEQRTLPRSSPFLWWPDACSRPPPSQWLHSTLSELDEKIKIILDLIDCNGTTFAKRAEMYYQRRPQLIKMVQDLHGSYKELADKYDHLRFKFEPSISVSPTTSLTNSFRRECKEETICQTNDWINKQMKFSELWEENMMKLGELIGRNDEKIEVINELRNENRGVINELKNDNMIWKREVINELRKENREVINELKNENMTWINKQMKFSELLEENLIKLGELIRKDDEKKEVITQLMNENMILSHNEGIKEKNKPNKMLVCFFDLFCFFLFFVLIFLSS